MNYVKIKNIIRKIYLNFKNDIDIIKINNSDEYERLQSRPGQLEYTQPRQMILSSLEYFIPKINETCEILGVQREQFKILDAGARDGWTVQELRKEGFEAVGIELVTELVEHAQSRGRNVLKGDIQNIQFPDSSFNAVFCRHTLEHTTDPARALSELIRVTTPQGIIFVSLPLERSAHGKHTTAIPNLRVLRHLVENTQATILDLRRSAETGVIIPDGDEALMILRRL